MALVLMPTLYTVQLAVSTAAFCVLLSGAVDPVRADLASVVQQTLEPAHLSAWTSRPTAPAVVADGRSS
jgi:hypothetical protein